MLYLVLVQTIIADCPATQCRSLGGNQCYEYTSNKITISECPSGQTCSASGFSNGTSHQLQVSQAYCASKSSQIEAKVPGEQCNLNEECKSNLCNLGRCEGLTEGSPCTSIADCAVGLSCSEVTSGFCILQQPIGSNCRNDYECVNSGSCHNGICREYFSLPEGTKFDNNSQDSYLCESGYLSADRSCSKAPKNKNDPNVECSRSQDCQLDVDGDSYYGFCYCGHNPGGKAFCKAVQGDQEFQDLKLAIKQLGKINSLCHINIAYTPRCPEIIGTPELNNFMKFQYLYLYRHSLIDAQDCAIELINPYATDYEYSDSVSQSKDESDDQVLVIIMGGVIGLILLAGVIACIFYARWRKHRVRPNIVLDQNDDAIYFSRTKIAKAVEGTFESKFTIDDFKIEQDGQILQGVPIGVKVDLVSYEVTDTFDYPLAITSDFKGGTTHIEDLEELLGSKDYPLLVSENK